MSNFGKIPLQEPPQPVRTVEPPQPGERCVTLGRRARLPIQMISYHVTNAAHPDAQALDVLGPLLTQGRSSRLHQRMVDKDEIALEVSQFLQPGLDPGQLIFVINPRAGVDPAITEKVLFEEIERIRSAEVPADELQKAKNFLLSDLYRQMTTISGRANLLGTYDVYRGDYRKLYSAQDEIKAVTADDVLRAAKQYLTARNRTIGTLIPEIKQ